MRILFIYTFVMVMMMPPGIVHNHIIVYEDVDDHLELEHIHEDFHHKDDSEHDKNTKHHHHCTVELSFITVFLQQIITCEIRQVISEILKINYYKSSHTTKFVGNIFHPPRI